MHFRTGVVSVGDAASVPESPSCSRSSIAEVGGVGLEEIEFVGWILVDGAAEQREQNQEDCASN